jgi:hypothetical protein
VSMPAKPPASPPQDDDMPAEIDFSGGGVRGRFYRPEAKLSLPVYLDADVRAEFGQIATQEGMAF